MMTRNDSVITVRNVVKKYPEVKAGMAFPSTRTTARSFARR